MVNLKFSSKIWVIKEKKNSINRSLVIDLNFDRSQMAQVKNQDQNEIVDRSIKRNRFVKRNNKSCVLLNRRRPMDESLNRIKIKDKSKTMDQIWAFI